MTEKQDRKKFASIKISIEVIDYKIKRTKNTIFSRVFFVLFSLYRVLLKSLLSLEEQIAFFFFLRRSAIFYADRPGG
jgi:lipopolysaccharide/colanic/teichoic acid biosynthesis glycosyltransferase